MPAFCLVIGKVVEQIQARFIALAALYPQWKTEWEAIRVWAYVDDILVQVHPALAPVGGLRQRRVPRARVRPRFA